MKLTADILRAKSACHDGVKWFSGLFPDGWTGEWTPMHQAIMLGDPVGRQHWGWAVANGIIPAWAMAGWRLARADLARADLYGANLTGADLAGANLYGASLYFADLAGANLTGANLAGANIIGASLYFADLAGANLIGANLTGANLGAWKRGPDGYATKKGDLK